MHGSARHLTSGVMGVVFCDVDVAKPHDSTARAVNALHPRMCALVGNQDAKTGDGSEQGRAN